MKDLFDALNYITSDDVLKPCAFQLHILCAVIGCILGQLIFDYFHRSKQ